jgi:hypothetical protein
MGQDSTTPIVIPINVVDDPFEEVKTGLIYIGKDLPRDNNLFFIRSNEHFRYCAIFDDERKSRARLDVTEGKLISVGISKGHCVQFVFNNFDIFIGLIKLMQDFLTRYKDARKEQNEKIAFRIKREEDKKNNANGTERSNQALDEKLEKAKLEEKSY